MNRTLTLTENPALAVAPLRLIPNGERLWPICPGGLECAQETLTDWEGSRHRTYIDRSI